MRITRLQLHDFRRYRDLDVTLSPGLTIIRGPNEAGKTTIQRALELVLTRKVTSTNSDLESLRPWDAGADARPVISLEFVQEDLDETRKGYLEKVFAGAKGTVRLQVDGEETSDPARADEMLADLTGIPTEQFFRSTASIRHHEVHDLDRDEANLRDRLQASISGADRGTSAAKKKLERALRDLNTRGDKNPGRLKVAEEAVQRTQTVVELGEKALAQLEQDRDSLALAKERRAAAETALAERRSLLEKARQAERLNSERHAAKERYERHREAVTVSHSISELNESHPSAEPLPVLRQVVERLRKLDGRIRELRAKLEGEIEVQFEVKTPQPTWRPIAIVAIVLILAGVGLAAAATLGGVQTETFLQAGLAAVGLGAVLAYVGIRQRRFALDLRRQKELRDVEIDRRLRGRSELEAELRQAEADTADQLEALGAENLAEAEDLLRREEQHVASLEQLAAQLQGLVGKTPTESLPALRDAAALEIEQKTAALEHLGPIAKEPRARERLEVEVREQEAVLEHARDEEANARARVEANPVDAEQVALEAERLAMWREQLAALQRRGRVFETTLKAIERAERATMRTATRYLEKRMVRDVDRITSGRYRRVRVDDRSLGIDVFAPEKGDWVDVSHLSQATLDQIYLAARLGLVRLVTGDRRPPLIFDDAFVTFDEDRARRALAVLRELASDFQIIYLTTSDRYDDSADAVVELPAPTAVDSGADEADAEPTVGAAGA